MKVLKLWASALMVAGGLASTSNGQYLEKGTGYVLMEAEKTASVLTPCWTQELQKNPSGGIALRQSGCNNTSSGPALAPLKYTFTTQTAGTYMLTLKIWKDHALTKDSADKSNDVYVRVEGDYTSGGTSPIEELKKDNKLYGGLGTGYAWSRDSALDFKGMKWPAKYAFKSGQTYSLYMSARAKNCVVDQILFSLDKDSAVAKAAGTPESPTVAGGGGVVDPVVGTKIIYKARPDFTQLPATGNFVAYTPDHISRPTVAMIDASIPANRLKWAAAEVVFNGIPGVYTFNLTGMKETDGETSYKVYVNGTQVGTTFQNEFINLVDARDYELQVHTIPSVSLVKGDKIRVESDCHSNGKKQESGQPAGTWAWARGRWTQLELVPTATGIHRAVKVNSKSKISKKGKVILFQDPRSRNSEATFTAEGKKALFKPVK